MALKGLGPRNRGALVVVEMQNGITHPDFAQGPLVEQVHARGIVARINRLAGAFRGAGLPVVHCIVSARRGFAGWAANSYLAYQIAKENKLIAGSEQAAINRDIVVEASDFVNERHHGLSVFTGTDLDPLLRACRVDAVVLAGVSTNVALIGSAIEAVGLGYTAVLAEDCAAGFTAESHQAQLALNLSAVASIAQSDEIIAALAPA